MTKRETIRQTVLAALLEAGLPVEDVVITHEENRDLWYPVFPNGSDEAQRERARQIVNTVSVLDQDV